MASVSTEFVGARPAVVLLGDSLTQGGGHGGGWAQAAAEYFSRRADVINRGLSGYNTRWALEGLHLMAAPHATTALTTVWYGANDAADGKLNARQHVSLDEYRKNLAEIVTRVRRGGCDRVIVLSPPPIHEEIYRREFIEPRAGKGAPLDRTLESSRLYAAVAREVAAAAGCPFVDLWAKVQAAAPAPAGPGPESDPQPWGRFLYDGLHFSREGQDLVWRELRSTIAEHFAELAVQPDERTGSFDNSGSAAKALPPHLPWHDAITSANQGEILANGKGKQTV